MELDAHVCHDPRREDRRAGELPSRGRSPRSRGPVGVGDVAGERGDRAAPSRPAIAGLRRGSRLHSSSTWIRPSSGVRGVDSGGDVSRRDAVIATASNDLGSLGRIDARGRRIIDAGDRVVVRSHYYAARAGQRGRGGRARLARLTLRDGKVVRCELLDHGRSPRSRRPVGARRSRRLLSLRDTARAMSQENVEIVPTPPSRPGTGEHGRPARPLDPDSEFGFTRGMAGVAGSYSVRRPPLLVEFLGLGERFAVEVSQFADAGAGCGVCDRTTAVAGVKSGYGRLGC